MEQKHDNVNVKMSHIKNGFSWNPSRCICENDKFLKSIFDTSVIGCDKFISVKFGSHRGDGMSSVTQLHHW